MWTAKAHELHKIAFMGPLGHAGWAYRVLTDLKLENGSDLL